MNPNSPYLPVAPIYNDVLTSDNKFTDAWKNHFDSIAETLGYVVVHDRLEPSKQETPVTVVISMSKAMRDQLQNAVNGSVIYNTTTNRMNFRENGAWVTFTPIPA